MEPVLIISIKFFIMVIIEYKAEHQQRFKELNIQWISRNFEIEEVDYQVLNDPDQHILKDGGCILLAAEKGEIIGTCALLNEGHGIFELTKMTVDERYRGMKIGYKLGVAVLEKAKQLSAKKVILYSNTVHNGNAINLYRKLGFTERPLGQSVWVRADIKMEIGIQ